jgi:serine/threonine protein kinase
MEPDLRVQEVQGRILRMNEDQSRVGEQFKSLRSQSIWTTTRFVRRIGDLVEFAARPGEKNPDFQSDYRLLTSIAGLESSHLETASLQIGHAAAALEDCQHPHLLQLVDHDTTHKQPFLVTVDFESDSLSHWLEQDRLTSLPVGLWIVRQVAQGISEMHSGGWQHNAVTDNAVRISSAGHAVLGDFLRVRRSQNGVVQMQTDISAIGKLLETVVEQAAVEKDTQLNELIAATKSNAICSKFLVSELLRTEMRTFSMHIQPAKTSRAA